MTIETVSANPEIEALLAGAGLPVSDLLQNKHVHFLGFQSRGKIIGVVGIEIHGQSGLLRSLVVHPDFRQEGLGGELVQAAEILAKGNGVENLFLLTTTAAGFFANRGYETVQRSAAPTEIATTSQFREICPASATLMRKMLSPKE